MISRYSRCFSNSQGRARKMFVLGIISTELYSTITELLTRIMKTNEFGSEGFNHVRLFHDIKILNKTKAG